MFNENPQLFVKELVLVAVEKTVKVRPLESGTSMKAYKRGLKQIIFSLSLFLSLSHDFWVTVL